MVDKVLTATKEKLEKLQDWEVEGIGEVIKVVGEDSKQPTNVVMQILRYAVAGLEPGVGVPAILEILGSKISLARLERCLAHNQTITS